MWVAIVAAVSKFFEAIPSVLDYLKINKVLKKDSSDKTDREKDIEFVEKNNKAIIEVVKDGKVDDINKKFGWKE